MEERYDGISQYQYTKAIRFNLEELEGNLREVQKEQEDNKKEIDLGSFYDDGLKISEYLKEFLYERDKEGKFKKDWNDDLIFDKLISVKKNWLKLHFKNDFYRNGKRKEFLISQIQYIQDGFKEWFKEFEKNLEEIKRLHRKSPVNKKEPEKSVLSFRSDIGFHLLKISSNSCFGFIRAFIESVNHKNETIKIMDLEWNIKKFREQLETLREEYLPSQSIGLCIAKGSMNYYAVNKKPKEYYEKEIEKVEEQLKDKRSYYYDKNSKNLKIGKDSFTLGQQPNCEEIKYLEKLDPIRNSGGDKVYFDISQIKDLMKDLKAKMKSSFFELCKKDTGNLENRFFLFENKAFIEKVKNLTRQIELNNRINQNNNGIRSDFQKLRKERGKYLIKNGFKDREYFEKWLKFVDTYRKISMDYGRLKAQIKGIEREKIEAENNKYWVLFLEQKNEKFVLLVPKEVRGQVRDKLIALTINQSEDTDKIWIMESLTKRALHKLCFAKASTFAGEMEKEDKDLYDELNIVNKATDDKEKLGKERRKNANTKSKTELMLPFLKNVLRSDYTNERLNLKNFDFTKVYETESLDKFELELENACYKWKDIPVSEEFLNTLVDNYSIIKCRITSYDLENRNKNVHQTPESNYKRHTVEIWNKFWEDDESIRLNPEIKIHFREQDLALRQHLMNKGFNVHKIKHRNLEDKYTLTMSFSLNAGKKHPELAFAKAEDLLKKIGEFNEAFNKRNWESFYKYGIDRGLIELATLCIAKFDKSETYEVNGKTLVKPKFPEDIKCYELKKEFYDKCEKPNSNMVNIQEIKPRRIIANLSYFIDRTDDKNWFEEKTCTCIDLTTAKVIRNKIILNGDVLTFLKLKKEGAKRIIFDKYNKDSKLDYDYKEENNNSIPLKLDNQPIYYFDKRFEGLLVKKDLKYTKENILNSLQKYLTQLKQKRDSEHKPSVVKLNHLRDSLVANMIGIISFLQEQYPGFVILEDLNVDTVDEHFKELYIDISRRMEFGLFNKFQTLGLVPPHIKNLIEIRETSRKGRENEIREKIKRETGKKELSKNQENKIKNKMKDYSEQFGAVIFVNEVGTSTECPYCEKQWNWDNNNNDEGKTIKILKNKERRYLCGKHTNSECDFDTYNINGKYEFLKEIKDPDKVATYNIAKKIKKYEDIKNFEKS